MTQEQLAQAATMSKAGVTHLEQGMREPTWKTIQKLAQALGVGVEVFAEESGDVVPRGRGRPKKDLIEFGGLEKTVVEGPIRIDKVEKIKPLKVEKAVPKKAEPAPEPVKAKGKKKKGGA